MLRCPPRFWAFLTEAMRVLLTSYICVYSSLLCRGQDTLRHCPSANLGRRCPLSQKTQVESRHMQFWWAALWQHSCGLYVKMHVCNLWRYKGPWAYIKTRQHMSSEHGLADQSVKTPHPEKGGIVLSRCGERRIVRPSSKNESSEVAFKAWVKEVSSQDASNHQPTQGQEQWSIRCKWRAKMKACVDSSPVVLLQPNGELDQKLSGRELFPKQYAAWVILLTFEQVFQGRILEHELLYCTRMLNHRHFKSLSSLKPVICRGKSHKPSFLVK